MPSSPAATVAPFTVAVAEVRSAAAADELLARFGITNWSVTPTGAAPYDFAPLRVDPPGKGFTSPRRPRRGELTVTHIVAQVGAFDAGGAVSWDGHAVTVTSRSGVLATFEPLLEPLQHLASAVWAKQPDAPDGIAARVLRLDSESIAFALRLACDGGGPPSAGLFEAVEAHQGVFRGADVSYVRLLRKLHGNVPVRTLLHVAQRNLEPLSVRERETVTSLASDWSGGVDALHDTVRALTVPA
jgi:hypothetical protein